MVGNPRHPGKKTYAPTVSRWFLSLALELRRVGVIQSLHSLEFGKLGAPPPSGGPGGVSLIAGLAAPAARARPIQRNHHIFWLPHRSLLAETAVASRGQVARPPRVAVVLTARLEPSEIYREAGRRLSIGLISAGHHAR